MATLATPAPTAATSSPSAAAARLRGLKRSRAGGPCPPPATVPVPERLSGLTRPEFLALLARVYDADVAAGRRLSRYDLQAYKSCWALLCHLHRLGQAAPASAHIATSSVQLVRGLTPVCGWAKSADRFEDRDRHHSWLRRNLKLLERAKLIELYAGVNDELEHLRTEVMLIDPPELLELELQAARVQHARWTGKYGRDLTTNTTTGVRSLRGVRLVLRPADRARRARARCVQVAQARADVSDSSSQTAHPFGAAGPSALAETPAAKGGGVPQTAVVFHCNQPSDTNACGSKTRAQAGAHPENLPWTTTNDKVEDVVVETAQRQGTAVAKRTARTPAGEDKGFEEQMAGRGEFVGYDAAFRERAADLLDLRVAQAQRRHDEVAGWAVGRRWPAGRVLEAWAVAHHGAVNAALDRRIAGFLGAGWADELDRALARYDRWADHRPEKWPARGWAGFLQAAAAWEKAELCIGTIRLFTALTRRMKALGRAHDPRREAKQRAAAALRRGPDLLRPWLGEHRWPRHWVLTDPESGAPLFHGPGLAVDLELAPKPESAGRRQAERDAHLLTGRSTPGWCDGPKGMAYAEQDRPDRGGEDPARASAQPAYRQPGKPAPPSTRAEREHREVAAAYKLPLTDVARMQPGLRQQLLDQARERRRTQQEIERTQAVGQALQDRIIDPVDPAAGSAWQAERDRHAAEQIADEIRELARLEELPDHQVARWSARERQALLGAHRRRIPQATEQVTRAPTAAATPASPPLVEDATGLAGIGALLAARRAQKAAQQPMDRRLAPVSAAPRLRLVEASASAAPKSAVQQLRQLLEQADPVNAWPPDARVRARAAAADLAARHALELEER